MTVRVDRLGQLYSRSEWRVGRAARRHVDVEHEIGRHTGKKCGPLIRADIKRTFEERRVDTWSKIHRFAPRVIDGGAVRNPQVRPWRAERTRAVRPEIQGESVERNGGCDVEEGARNW